MSPPASATTPRIPAPTRLIRCRHLRLYPEASRRTSTDPCRTLSDPESECPLDAEERREAVRQPAVVEREAQVQIEEQLRRDVGLQAERAAGAPVGCRIEPQVAERDGSERTADLRLERGQP